jgi:UDP-2,3-diacylglucosamine pyrophosphatase LpxH
VRQVFVISDLHLGGVYPSPDSGQRGFRLCTHASAVARFVDRLTADIAEKGPSELVVNGDIVDFLAERNPDSRSWSAFTSDPQLAADKFEAIVDRDREVFRSFGRFLDARGRLVILLGNHDIELSLPPVRAALRRAIGIKPEHDFEFIGDGEAYIIGDALIEHGNRYDAWNQVDYDSLRRVRSLMSRRQPVPAQYSFVAPAGSEMVATVMNAIKEKYAFVDLLKPETSAVVPMLLALEPSYRKRFGAISRLWYSTRSHGLEGPILPRIGGEINAADVAGDATLGHDIAATETSIPELMDDDAALKEALKDALGNEGEFLDRLEGVDTGRRDASIGTDISAVETFTTVKGIFDLVFGSRESKDRLAALLIAMRALQGPDGFDRSKETAKEYLDAARELAKGNIRYVIFGHTHQAKQVDLGDGRWYLNSGTWADVLRFPLEILNLPDAEALVHLQAFVDQMKAGNFTNLTLFQPTYVRLDIDDNGKVSKAELCEAAGR